MLLHVQYLSEIELILSMAIFLLMTSTSCPFMGPFLIWGGEGRGGEGEGRGRGRGGEGRGKGRGRGGAG